MKKEKTLDELKLIVERKREIVKRAKAALKAAPAARKSIMKRTLKGMKTKLHNAEMAYKAAKPKGAIHKKVDGAANAVKNGVKSTTKFLRLKEMMSWAFISAATVGVGIAGIVAYDYFGKDDAVSE